MIWRCLDCLLILAAFAGVYLLPPLIATRRLLPGSDKVTLITAATGLGLSSQALLGFGWNHLAPHHQILEAGIYFALWISISLVVVWRLPAHPHSTPPPSRDSIPLLPLILLSAVALRSIDGLASASLGQSDAYTHLQFLRDVVQNGEIRNIVYPPGYSWVLALPVMVFNLDAYMVARYVGPFFGVMLVATVYLLGSRHRKTTGLSAAFLVAACPAFYPLVKTGMGAFANQLGLFLLPLALFLHLARERLLFMIVLLGLTVCVPLLVLTLALVVFAHGMITGQRVRGLLLLTIPFLLALGLAAYHFLSPGKLHVTATSTLVTGIETPVLEAWPPSAPPPTLLTRIHANPAGKLMVDLLTIKRLGLGSGLMNAAALGLAVTFTVILIAGMRPSKRRPPVIMEPGDSGLLELTGCWGLLTTIQVATGFLEFSFYQRSGWILLQAVALAAGLIISILLHLDKPGRIVRPIAILGLTACLLLSFWFPPRHRTITSGAENELATVLRELSDARLRALEAPQPFRFEKMEPRPLIARAAMSPHLTVVTRRYTLFSADQGNLAGVLPDPGATIRHMQVQTGTRLQAPADDFLCLVDRYTGLPATSLLDQISPALTHSLARSQSQLYAPNGTILALVDSLPANRWHVQREEAGCNLTLIHVTRQATSTGRHP